MTAHDLLPKLKLLYKIGMVSYVHHLDQKNFKTKAAISKSSGVGKQSEQESMQFPFPQDMAIHDQITEANDDIDRLVSRTSQSQRSGGRESQSSKHGNDNNAVPGMSRTSSIGRDNQNQGDSNISRRKGVSPKLSSENIMGKNSRRSSSISADQVRMIGQQHQQLPANNLIKEEKNEDSSGSSNHGLTISKSAQKAGGKTNNNVQTQGNVTNNKQGRFSQEVQNATVAQLRKELANKRNSDDSSVFLSTPPTGGNNLGTITGQQPMSSQGLSYSDPTMDGRGEGGSKDDETSGFNLAQVMPRENRQTFASRTGESGDESTPPESIKKDQRNQQYIQQTNVMPATHQYTQNHHQQKPSKQYKSQDSSQRHLNRSRRHDVQNTSINGPSEAVNQSTQSRRQQLSGQYQVDNLDKSEMMSFDPQGFDANTSKDQKTYAPTNNDSAIGKDVDNKKELSIIQHKYDSRTQGDFANSSVLEPLNIANQSKTGGAPVGNVSNSIDHSNSDSNNQNMMSSISSMIKQQLDQGLSSILQDQKEKLDRMAQLQQLQQQAMSDQMNRQQQQILNSSFQQNAIMTPQAQQPQVPAAFYMPHPQTPTQYQQLPQMMRQQQMFVGQSPYAMTMPDQSSQMMGSPQRPFNNSQSMTYGPSGQPYFHPPQQFNGQQILPTHSGHMMDYSGISDNQSVGGITSKRSHKHLLDSAQQPIQSKQETESFEDEPADPDDSYDPNEFQSINRPKHDTQNVQQHPHRPPAYYELDLQAYQDQNLSNQRSQQHQRNQQAMSNSFQQQSSQHQNRQQRHQDPQQVRSFNDPSQDHHLMRHDAINTAINRSFNQRNYVPGPIPSQSAPAFNYQSRTEHQQPRMVVPQQFQAVAAAHQQSSQYHHSGHNQNLRSREQSYDHDENISAKTVKPTYSGVITDQNSTRSGIYPVNGTPTAHYELQQMNMSLQRGQSEQYSTRLEFADRQLVFPPPEKWTETQYAMYEEPLVSQQNDDKWQGVMLAVAVRDSVELRMSQLKIPKGTKVQVLETQPQHQTCRIDFKGHQGLYKLQDFIKSDVQEHQSPEISSLKQRKSAIVKENTSKRQSKAISKGVAKGKTDQYAFNKETKQAVNAQQQPVSNSIVSIDVSHDQLAQGNRKYRVRDSMHLSSGLDYGQQKSGDYRGVHHQNNSSHHVQNRTIEQMSPIDNIEDPDISGTIQHKNFFREDPEKHLSKHLKNMQPWQLAQTSKQLLIEDKDEHKQKNLKLVERQKAKAQAVRKQTSRPKK